ncbi:four helix bundle protein [Salinimicrobium catena]|uniref:four helix bundle protein n=1 Tax=Salinimicrobium catena TaxID=390640 RepID=UPI002FE4AAD1
MIKSFKDLDIYQESYALAMEIFRETRQFPKEETFSFTSQIVRTSRSVAANIFEGWSKRQYEQIFKQQLVNALGSNGETETWLDFALDCNYLSKEVHGQLREKNEIVGKKINRLHQNWKNYGK